MHRMASVGFLPLVLLVACARLGEGPPQSPPAMAATPAPPPGKPLGPPDVSTLPAQPAPASPVPPAGAAQSSAGKAIPPAAPKAASSPGSSSGTAPAKAKAASTGRPVKPAAGEERTAPAEKSPAVEGALQQPAAPPALDLTGLEERLRDTRAIGVFTKLSLKNNVDDLLAAFRAFYNGQLSTTLSELRQRYDILLMKVLTLLQNGDPALAQAINASRDAIWGILSDREKFQKFSLH